MEEMTISQLPTYILSDIFSHFFGSIQVPAKGSSSPLLVSQSFRALALPFFWRSLHIHRPSGFVSLFDPKAGLLHVKGGVGKQRREWVRELFIGNGAAVPYDLVKVEKACTSKKGIEGDKGRELQVSLKPAKLPNLRCLSLGTVNYLSPGADAEDPSYDDLVDRIEAREEKEWQERKKRLPKAEGDDIEQGRGECGFGEILSTCYGGFFGHLAYRNNEIVGSLLTSSLTGGQLADIHLPFGPVLGWDRSSSLATLSRDARIPSYLSQAKNLIVTLHPLTGYHYPSFDVLRTAQILASQVGSKPRVRMEKMRESDKNQLVQAIEKTDRKKLEMLALWEFVEDDGSLSPLVPSL